MNELALFAGAGGGILGGKLLGWRTVCAVEWEPYPASVLCARQNDKVLPPFPIWDDVQTFDGKPWRGIVDVVSGGFPCQDISAAGKGAGITGERSGMWKHMARIIGEVRPRYVFVENSPMLTLRGLGVVLGDLSEMGFNAEWGVISAADVGAPHKRDRIWICGTHPDSERWNDRISDWQERSVLRDSNWDAEKDKPERQGWQRGIGEVGADVAYPISTGTGVETHRSCGQRRKSTNTPQSEILRQEDGQTCTEGISPDSNNVANSTSKRQSGSWISWEWCSSAQDRERQASYVESIGRPEQWSIEPNVGRVANGVAARVDRLKAIGNGQVPLCAATAWRVLESS